MHSKAPAADGGGGGGDALLLLLLLLLLLPPSSNRSCCSFCSGGCLFCSISCLLVRVELAVAGFGFTSCCIRLTSVLQGFPRVVGIKNFGEYRRHCLPDQLRQHRPAGGGAITDARSMVWQGCNMFSGRSATDCRGTPKPETLASSSASVDRSPW